MSIRQKGVRVWQNIWGDLTRSLPVHISLGADINCRMSNWLRSWHTLQISVTDSQTRSILWQHVSSLTLLAYDMWLKDFLVGHYLRCGDKHIALISSAIISSGQTGAEPTKAGQLASLLLTYLHCLTDSLFAHFHCGNKIKSNYKVPGLSVHERSR